MKKMKKNVLLKILYAEISKTRRICGLLIENYIDSGAKFPISMWTVISSSSERTTNVYESFRSKYNLLFYRHHSDILYTFLEILILNELGRIRAMQKNMTIFLETHTDDTLFWAH